MTSAEKLRAAKDALENSRHGAVVWGLGSGSQTRHLYNALELLVNYIETHPVLAVSNRMEIDGDDARS